MYVWFKACANLKLTHFMARDKIILNWIYSGESMLQKEELDQQLRSLSDTYKHKRKQMKQLLEDVQNMEDAYNSMNNDERNYEELIQDKFNKIKQGEKDIEQIKEKLEQTRSFRSQGGERASYTDAADSNPCSEPMT